jgi:TonB family protein
MDAKNLMGQKCFRCCTMTSKTRLLVLLLFCPGLVSASGQQVPSAQQLLDAAHKATDIASAGAYVLHATIVINPGDPKFEHRGELTIVRDHDRACFTLEADGRTEDRIVLGSKQFVIPGQGTLFGLGLANFDHSWDPGPPPKFASHEKSSFGKVRKQKIHGHDAWCFEQKLTQSKTKLCFDAATSVLLEDSSENRRNEYSDYEASGPSLYPQKVQLVREKHAPFEVQRISITPTQLNDDTFKVPDKAVEVEECDDEENPKPLHTPEPEFSDAARTVQAHGVVYLYVLVNAKGNVAVAQALGMDAYGLAQNAVNTVKAWRFKPATCSGRPVTAEVNIEVEFSHR